jgi:hypothetical protein
MKRKTRHVLIYILLWITISALLLDFLLYHIDPTGVVAYYADFSDLQSHSMPAPDGARYTPGTYHFRKYTVTIGLEGFRAVPESRGGDCRIAFLGDSVTFGMGSDISFVDLLAPDINATVVNAGIPGYSAANVLSELGTIPADGYVWLIVANDDDPRAVWRRSAGELPSATALYLSWLFPFEETAAVNESRFTNDADKILARDDVLSFVFAGQRLTKLVQERYPQVRLIAPYTGFVSHYDRHADPVGARQIADAMRPYVLAFVKQQCP